ncbi:Phosphoglycerol transferase MdoB [Pseudobutyrivibrio sp. YE44]|uniref:LTA synthase family protein n=1 Tax=Pseudobutyrivibrio sp. YE44 TaxID=1520802 RepID=UPI000884B092|nr:LTA synthase family protein [Pseudobutyrivibrio sp. YE44]SDB28186.1 Phosphoglycerol transferase MdoB [Pseudobutyrivibrio sp. YE44]
MKKVFSRIKSGLSWLGNNIKKPFSKLANSKAVQGYINSKFRRKWLELWDKSTFWMQIPLALLIIFVMEWLSRHSFGAACGFVIHHTGPYLFNAYCVFVALSIVFLSRRRGWWRVFVTMFFIILGIINSVILLNRVSPFGYTDLYMISDLLTMQDSNYFSAQQAMLAIAALIIYIIIMVIYAKKGPKKQDPKPFWMRLVLVAGLFVSLYPSTILLRNSGIMTSYFGNLAQGYLDYGYLYGFSTSVLDRGMSRPFGYSEAKIDTILENDGAYVQTLQTADGKRPNIVVILLESFYDVSECEFLETSEDPIPFIHSLEKNYSTGHCIVPVVGAGTCNSEFEVLTGLSCNFFGPGEYPQKTILKQVDVESYADVLNQIGYTSHVVHNNGGNFYSRKNAFSQMGFDTFTSKEMLDITEYTPLGNWPTDDILLDATMDAMDSTEGSDFVYTITVEGHGSYPEYVVEEDPEIKVKANGKTEGQNNAWEYYVNRIHNVDDFIKQYIQAFDERGEDTIVIMFGDHLPTMGLTADEVATGDLYKTKYFTWNNFDMPKEDMDLASYQLVSEYLNRLGIHNGNINGYHQTAMAAGKERGTSEYMNDLRMLQYDIMYGNRYTYKDGTAYKPSEIEMGVNDVTIDKAYFFNGKLHIYGDQFSKWSKVYIGDEQISTKYESGQVLTVKASDVHNGDKIKVCQVGSSNTIFRESNEYIVYDPNYVEEEEENEIEDATEDGE